MRRFSIPSLTALAASLGGCTDPLVGTWACTEFDGEDMPQVETYTSYYGGDFDLTSSVSLGMTIFSDLVGHLEYNYQVTATGYITGNMSYGESFRLEATAEGGRDYNIEFFGQELDCSLTGDELECEDEDGRDIEFERSDPDD